MNRFAALAVAPLLALSIAAAPTRGPELEGVARERLVCLCCEHGFELVQRPQDPRVTRALIEAAGRLTSADKTELLIAIAQNTTISAESELLLIEESGSLTAGDRKQVLSVLARTVRMSAARGSRD